LPAGEFEMNTPNWSAFIMVLFTLISLPLIWILYLKPRTIRGTALFFGKIALVGITVLLLLNWISDQSTFQNADWKSRAGQLFCGIGFAIFLVPVVYLREWLHRRFLEKTMSRLEKVDPRSASILKELIGNPNTKTQNEK
jgi:hypothetical protein